jgi:hypothetical protein
MLVGGALTDRGSVIEWAAELLNFSNEEAFLNCVNRIEQLSMIDYATTSPGTTGVTMIPFLSGERSTGYRDGATGAVMRFYTLFGSFVIVRVVVFFLCVADFYDRRTVYVGRRNNIIRHFTKEPEIPKLCSPKYQRYKIMYVMSGIILHAFTC